jgi:hypothetical protein
MELDTLLSLCLGLGLAAACGFRVFVPLLITSLAAHTGHLDLAGGFDWIASTPALVTFGVATVLEILAYYVPWVDNVLDLAAAPAAVVAGTLITASVITDPDPLLRWSLAVIAGGGAAAAVQTATTVLRHMSSWATAGLGNHVLSTGEAVGSVGLALTSVLVPFFAALVVAALGLVALVLLLRRPWRQQSAPA